MINFRFIKSQIKLVIIPIIVAFVVLLVFIGMTLTESSFAPISATKESSESLGVDMTFNTFFLFPAIIVFFALSIFLIYNVLVREVSKGYYASWLTASLACKTTLVSKMLVIIVAILVLNLVLLILHLILFKIKYQDFNSQNALHVFWFYLSLAFITILATTISWFIICFFITNASIAISLASTLLILFFVLYILAFLGSQMKEFAFLQNFQYLTILGFLKPLTFAPFSDIVDPNKAEFAKNASLDLNLLWQIPVMLILASATFFGGNIFFCRKDLHL